MKTIKKIIKYFLYAASRIIPLRNYIVFESWPDFSDNSLNVYEELIKRGYNKKYKMIWLCFQNTREPSCKKDSNTMFIKPNIIRLVYYRLFSKVIICTNRFIEPFSERQFSIYLGHGTSIKDVKGYYKMPPKIKYCLAASDNTAEARIEEFSISREKIVPLGFPRNDDLTEMPIDLHGMFKNSFKKIIIWYPTFRQHASGLATGSKHSIPLLWNEDVINEVNSFCSKYQILIVIKPHFSQDLSFMREMDLSNIVFINDDFYFKNNITAYAFLGNCDALLTDYSSVYFDFALCDKPIGLVWEDYEEYKSNPGFSIDMDFAMKGGVKIYTKDDLLDFLMMVYKNEDNLRNERREIRDYYNYSNDRANTKRVADFIVSNAQL